MPEYAPGQPVPECYEGLSDAVLSTRLTGAFEHCLGVPSSILSTAFRAFVLEVFRSEAPALRCSAARAIMEGRVPGVPRPAEGFPANTKKQLNAFLLLADVFETISRHYESQHTAGVAADLQEAVELPKRLSRKPKREAVVV